MEPHRISSQPRRTAATSRSSATSGGANASAPTTTAPATPTTEPVAPSAWAPAVRGPIAPRPRPRTPARKRNRGRASHMTTPNHELFEGNESHKATSDTTWGNSLYITFFRNHLTGLRMSYSPLMEPRGPRERHPGLELVDVAEVGKLELRHERRSALAGPRGQRNAGHTAQPVARDTELALHPREHAATAVHGREPLAVGRPVDGQHLRAPGEVSLRRAYAEHASLKRERTRRRGHRPFG